MATVTFNIPKPLDEKIKGIARGKMLSKSALIRLVLKEHADNSKPVTRKLKGARG